MSLRPCSSTIYPALSTRSHPVRVQSCCRSAAVRAQTVCANGGCAVIGFPNGYDTTKAKCLEALDAVQNGADEVDMVINIGWVKDQRWDDLLEEIKAVKQHCEGKLLKVIIETCLLTDDEKIKMCEIVSDSGADYIKTSTGFSTGGATFHDVELFAKHVKPGVKIKAAGGISSLEDAEKFIDLGASRLGTSRVVKIVKKLEAEKQ